MHPRQRHTRGHHLLGLVLATAAATAGCGSGGGGGGGGTESSAAVFFQDAAAPITLTADQQPVFEMHELWLTISNVALRRSDGQLVSLTMTANPLTVDVMALDSTSVVLGWVDRIPPGRYDALELTVDSAQIAGTDLQTNQAGVFRDIVPDEPVFEAEFQPEHVTLGSTTATSMVIDWRPAVSAERDAAGTVRYLLDDDVHAFVVGASNAPGQPLPVSDMEGEVVALDCMGGMITVEIDEQRFQILVDNATVFQDDRRQTLAGGCADVAIGDELEIDGNLQPGNTVIATVVRNKDVGDDDGSHGGNAAFEQQGAVDQVQSSATPSFELRQGSRAVALIQTTNATRFKYDDHHPMAGTTPDPAQAVANGVRVSVEGYVTGTDPTSGLPVIDAEEVEIR